MPHWHHLCHTDTVKTDITYVTLTQSALTLPMPHWQSTLTLSMPHWHSQHWHYLCHTDRDNTDITYATLTQSTLTLPMSHWHRQHWHYLCHTDTVNTDITYATLCLIQGLHKTVSDLSHQVGETEKGVRLSMDWNRMILIITIIIIIIRLRTRPQHALKQNWQKSLENFEPSTLSPLKLGF